MIPYIPALFSRKVYRCDAEDNTLMVLDFGKTLFSFVYGTFAGTNTEFGQPSFFGSKGSIVGDKFNGNAIDYPGKANPEMHPRGPHVTAAHRLEECHVFEDIMQLVDLVREGIPTPATPEHARHVVEIIEAALRASEAGQTQELKTTFVPPDGE